MKKISLFPKEVYLYLLKNSKKFVSDMMKKFHEMNIKNDCNCNLSYIIMKPKNNTKHHIHHGGRIRWQKS